MTIKTFSEARNLSKNCCYNFLYVNYLLTQFGSSHFLVIFIFFPTILWIILLTTLKYVEHKNPSFWRGKGTSTVKYAR